MRKVVWILLAAVILAVGGWFGYQRYLKANTKTDSAEIVLVKRGDILATVSATGAVQAERQANLSLQMSGIVRRVAVEVGDSVEAGQVLAELDTKDLELALRQAQISLRMAQAQLQQLKSGPAASDLAASQAALASAQSAYQQLLNGADADQTAAARAAVEQARAVLNQAQQAYDKIKDMPNAGMLPPALQLQQATINYETAQAQFRVTTRGASQAQIAASQAQIAQAQAALDRLQRGASAEQIDVAQAGVDQAQLAVEQAQRRLDNSRLSAPWAGVATMVNLVEGSIGQPGTPAVQLSDQSQYHVNVQVDEVDIASLAVDQPVTIELDALADRKLTGHVAQIAPAATINTSGAVAYLVTIHFDPTDAPLRAGMSATATITSSTRKNVLLIPNRAVQVVRESGATFVERRTPSGPQRVEIRIGLRDEQQSEVREGLAEGDELVIISVSMQQKLQQSLGGM